MAHISTVKLLVAWARWGEGVNLDCPSTASFYGIKVQTSLHGVGHIPDDVAEVETAVCKLEWFHRMALIYRYQRKLSWLKIGEKFNVNWRTGQKTVRQAEDCVEQLLRNVGEGSIKAHQSKLRPSPA